jgi:hypothetical protein
MTTERDQNRAAHPEFAAAIDLLRSRGVQISAAWIEDAEGVVIAGRRPPSVMNEVWVDAEKIADLRRDFYQMPWRKPRTKR